MFDNGRADAIVASNGVEITNTDLILNEFERRDEGYYLVFDRKSADFKPFLWKLTGYSLRPGKCILYQLHFIFSSQNKFCVHFIVRKIFLSLILVDSGGEVQNYSTKMIFKLISTMTCNEVKWYSLRQGILALISSDQYITVSGKHKT